MRAIVFSRLDKAGINIAKQLTSNFNFKLINKSFNGENIYALGDIWLVEINSSLLYAEHLDHLNAELLVFASKHKSQSEMPALLVHTPGNWTDDTSYGGNPRELGVACAEAMRAALQCLWRLKDELKLKDYKVSLEVTHHGPTSLKTPVVYVELGSSPQNWRDEKAAYAVAEACLEAARVKFVEKCCIGFGGPHYAPNFSRKVLFNDYRVGHMAPKYVFPKISFEVVKQAIKKSIEKVEFALVDWKGLRGEDRKRLINWLSEMNLTVERI